MCRRRQKLSSFIGWECAASVRPWVLVLAVFLNGLATGGALNYTLAHLLHLSHKDTHYITTSLLGTFRGFGGSFGGGRQLQRSLVE